QRLFARRPRKEKRSHERGVAGLEPKVGRQGLLGEVLRQIEVVLRDGAMSPHRGRDEERREKPRRPERALASHEHVERGGRRAVSSFALDRGLLLLQAQRELT